MADHYETLGVARDASAAEIKAAYRALSVLHHPDKGGDEEIFKQISLAYAILSDPEKREHYDRTGSDAPRQRSEVEEIAPIVIGAFDRAVIEALKEPVTPRAWMDTIKPKGLGSTDIVKSMVRLLREDIERGKEANAQIAAEINKMQEMQRRLKWKGTAEQENVLAAMLASKLSSAAEQTERNNGTIALVEKVIEHVRLYGWEVDAAPSATTEFGGHISLMYPEKILFEALSSQPGQFRAVVDEIYGHRTQSSRTRRPIRLSKEKRRQQQYDSLTGAYRRPYTFTLDADGRQTPPARGSWAEFERRVKQIQQRAA